MRALRLTVPVGRANASATTALLPHDFSIQRDVERRLDEVLAQIPAWVQRFSAGQKAPRIQRSSFAGRLYAVHLDEMGVELRHRVALALQRELEARQVPVRAFETTSGIDINHAGGGKKVALDDFA